MTAGARFVLLEQGTTACVLVGAADGFSDWFSTPHLTAKLTAKLIRRRRGLASGSRSRPGLQHFPTPGTRTHHERVVSGMTS